MATLHKTTTKAPPSTSEPPNHQNPTQTQPRTAPPNQQTKPPSPPPSPTVTLDILLNTLNYTLLHPWFAWSFLLTLRAQATPYTSTYFLTATAYAMFLTILRIAVWLNQRFAYGRPRKGRTILGNNKRSASEVGESGDDGAAEKEEEEEEEEVVVITGGASGLGLLVARVYGLRGVSVGVLDVQGGDDDDGYGDEVEGGFRPDGLQGLESVRYYRCDVGERDQVEEVVGRIEKELGTPTVLINCAAAGINGQSILSLPVEFFRRTFQTNLLAVFNTCQTILPRMLAARNGGSIVTVSSVLGHLTPANLSDYSTSKAGLSALHRTLEAELRASGNDRKVKMVLVETGQMKTPLFEQIQTPNSFFAPVLETVQVAHEIVSAVDSGRAGVIRLPAFAALVGWYGVLPASLQRFARYLSGIDYAVAKSIPNRRRSETESVGTN